MCLLASTVEVQQQQRGCSNGSACPSCCGLVWVLWLFVGQTGSWDVDTVCNDNLRTTMHVAWFCDSSVMEAAYDNRVLAVVRILLLVTKA